MARSLLTDTLWRVGLMAVAALLLVWLAVSAALRPLGRLSEAVQERAPDDLRPLPLVSVQRELRPLVVALNGFTERLRGQFERQARFIADASHELRTPLAALKARIELGLRDADPAAWRSTLEDAGQSTDKVIHLANQLLSWRASKAAHSPSPRAARSLNLSQLARELGLAMAALAHKRGVALALEAEAPVWIDGEPTLISELLSNLLDNAWRIPSVAATWCCGCSTAPCWRWRTTALAFRSPSAIASLPASIAATPAAMVPAWVWPSSARSSAPTAPRSASIRVRWAGCWCGCASYRLRADAGAGFADRRLGRTDHPVATGVLGGIQRRIRSGQQRLCRGTGRPQRGDARLMVNATGRSPWRSCRRSMSWRIRSASTTAWR